VVKVEPLRGDTWRHDPPAQARTRDPELDYGLVDNRGKKSVAIALDSPGGRPVRRLVARAEVFLCNLLPTASNASGSTGPHCGGQPEAGARRFTGYGMTGPDAAPRYDVTAFFAAGGDPP
jgi:crotonobetainyl-CoA:carnitine CoA-transferase CaiB-like acyl-CoA transferase